MARGTYIAVISQNLTFSVTITSMAYQNITVNINLNIELEVILNRTVTLT